MYPLTIEQITTLRKLRTYSEGASFLISLNVPATEFEELLQFIGTLPRDNAVSIFDPTRHRLWTLLRLNHCSYRAISTYFHVSVSTVHDAVQKYSRKHKVTLPHIKHPASMPELIRMVKQFSIDRATYAYGDPIHAAKELAASRVED